MIGGDQRPLDRDPRWQPKSPSEKPQRKNSSEDPFLAIKLKADAHKHRKLKIAMNHTRPHAHRSDAVANLVARNAWKELHSIILRGPESSAIEAVIAFQHQGRTQELLRIGLNPHMHTTNRIKVTSQILVALETNKCPDGIAWIAMESPKLRDKAISSLIRQGDFYGIIDLISFARTRLTNTDETLNPKARVHFEKIEVKATAGLKQMALNIKNPPPVITHSILGFKTLKDGSSLQQIMEKSAENKHKLFGQIHENAWWALHELKHEVP